jgi:hypothetical protein
VSLIDLVVILILLSVFFGMFRGGAWSWPPSNPLHAILYVVAVGGYGPRILYF